MTPLEIQFALTFHCTRDPVGNLGQNVWDSFAGRQTRESFKGLGLVIEHPNGEWEGTEKLAAYVKHLCRQPLPTVRWVVETGEAS